MKQIQYAGYSILKDGTWKFRTATDEKRIYQLEAFGESVYMIGIRPVASKGAAAKELLAMDYMGKNPECVAFFAKHAKDENPFKKTTRVVKLKVPSVAMQKLTGAQIETEELSTAEARRIRTEWNRRHAHLSYDGE